MLIGTVGWLKGVLQGYPDEATVVLVHLSTESVIDTYVWDANAQQLELSGDA